MLDPQYLQESTTEIDDNLPGQTLPEELVKTEFPQVFGPPVSPASTASGPAEKVEPSPGLEGKAKKENVLTNATKICLKFQLSNPPSTSGIILTVFIMCLYPHNFLLEVRVIVKIESNPCYPRI